MIMTLLSLFFGCQAWLWVHVQDVLTIESMFLIIVLHSLFGKKVMDIQSVSPIPRSWARDTCLSTTSHEIENWANAHATHDNYKFHCVQHCCQICSIFSLQEYRRLQESLGAAKERAELMGGGASSSMMSGQVRIIFTISITVSCCWEILIEFR